MDRRPHRQSVRPRRPCRHRHRRHHGGIGLRDRRGLRPTPAPSVVDRQPQGRRRSTATVASTSPSDGRRRRPASRCTWASAEDLQAPRRLHRRARSVGSTSWSTTRPTALAATARPAHPAGAWNKSYEVNLRGPVFLVQNGAAVPQRRAAITPPWSTCSCGAFLASTAPQSMYAGAKAGMYGLHACAGERVGGAHGIRVNALPGHDRHRHGAQQPAGGPRHAWPRGQSDEAGGAPRRDDGPPLFLGVRTPAAS